MAHSQPWQNANDNIAQQFLGVFRYSRRAIDLVWTTSHALTIGFALLTLCAGVLPAAAAYLGQLIVDSVVAAIDTYNATQVIDYPSVMPDRVRDWRSAARCPPRTLPRWPTPCCDIG